MVFFVKNFYLNFNFFQALQCTLLKNDIKNLLKKCKSPKNCLIVDIARGRSKTLKKKGKEKEKMRKFPTTPYLFLLFYIGKSIFC